MKVVIDTNVLISGLFWKGNPRKVIDLAISQQIQSVTCLEILQELQIVLTEDFHIPPTKLKDIVKDVLGYSQIVKIQSFDLKIRDLDDVKIIACAVSSGSDYIVTGDKDLLVLDQYHGIKIVTPSEFIKLL